MINLIQLNEIYHCWFPPGVCTASFITMKAASRDAFKRPALMTQSIISLLRVEAPGLGVGGQPGLHGEFQANQGYIVRSVSKHTHIINAHHSGPPSTYKAEAGG